MRVASEAVALRLLLLGEVLPAPAALALGLIHRVAPAQELETTVEELLDAMRGSAPIALGYAREAVRSGADLALVDGLRLEADLAVLLQTTQDRFEGINSFLDKRSPRYEGR
jgi:enoyl-CoA hydratase/carnithine racemase